MSEQPQRVVLLRTVTLADGRVYPAGGYVDLTDDPDLMTALIADGACVPEADYVPPQPAGAPVARGPLRQATPPAPPIRGPLRTAATPPTTIVRGPLRQRQPSGRKE